MTREFELNEGQLENQFSELVQNIVDIIRNGYEDEEIHFEALSLVKENYVSLTKFCEYNQLGQAIFALWALQNPDKVKYDIVSASESKLAIAFYTDASTGFYFDPAEEHIETFTKYPTRWSNERERAYPKQYSFVLALFKIILE